MAEIERSVSKNGVSYASRIKCETITGMPHNEIVAIVTVENPTEICIGTMYGLYAVKIEDIADIAKTALEEANKGLSMEIENKKQKLEFKDVYIGDVFARDGIYYMKIIKTDKGIAVILESGNIADFAQCAIVEEIEGAYVRKLY